MAQISDGSAALGAAQEAQKVPTDPAPGDAQGARAPSGARCHLAFILQLGYLWLTAINSSSAPPPCTQSSSLLSASFLHRPMARPWKEGSPQPTSRCPHEKWGPSATPLLWCMRGSGKKCALSPSYSWMVTTVLFGQGGQLLFAGLRVCLISAGPSASPEGCQPVSHSHITGHHRCQGNYLPGRSSVRH